MRWLILITYLIQLFTIIRFPVPSEVSTLQLLQQNPAQVSSVPRSLLVMLGGLGILTFHLPLIFILFPSVTPEHLAIYGYDHSIIYLAGICMCLIIGTTLTTAGVGTLRQTRTRSHIDDTPDLRSKGVYGLCRHPVNLGLMLIMLGLFLAYPLWIMLPGSLAFIYNLHVRARLEEKHLSVLYGNRYRDYQERVPMYGLPVRPK